jgi:spore coat protein U-like protein
MPGIGAEHRLALGLAFFFFSCALCAGTYTGATVSANTTVSANCTISAGALNFGAYDPIGAQKTTPLENGSTQISIACVQGSAPTIGLSLGVNASGSTRRMKNTSATDYLVYELYQPPSASPTTACTFPASVVWGTSGANLFTPTAPSNKNARAYYICAAIPAGQDPSIGVYNDLITASVNF